jgi:hypothetical protein
VPAPSGEESTGKVRWRVVCVAPHAIHPSHSPTGRSASYTFHACSHADAADADAACLRFVRGTMESNRKRYYGVAVSKPAPDLALVPVGDVSCCAAAHRILRAC